jgi:glycerate dehydrogenase
MADFSGLDLLQGFGVVKITVLDGFTTNPGDNPWTPLEAHGELCVYDNTSSEQLIARSSDADILIANKVRLESTSLAKLPKLKFISVLATGYDIVDIDAAVRQGVLVSNVPEYSTASVAQHVFTGLLSLLARPEEHHRAIVQGRWSESGQFSFWNHPLIELVGKTMGIVGLGKIGRAVARLANAFGMRVVAHSPSRRDPLPYSDFQWNDLGELFAGSDVVSLHCPTSVESKGMVNQALLSRMKATAVLINTARGALVNEMDLAAALNSGLIAGAFLDVVSVEPITQDNPLLTAKNCLLTPHQGWATIESRRRLVQATAENVAAFITGHPINVVNTNVSDRADTNLAH